MTKKQLAEIWKLKKADMNAKDEAAGIKVVVLTATMIQEDASNDLNKNLADYNDFLRELAKERDLPLADLNAQMQAGVAANPEVDKGRYYTGDGVHMNPRGNQMMAEPTLASWKRRRDMAIMPVSSGTKALAGPKKRTM